MDRVEKALAKLTPKERRVIVGILRKLRDGETKGLDIKKLKGRDDIFRVRKGDLRIIYRRHSGETFILAIERRKENTYDP
jgi:mRNA-degrading endonuclease RelE of RelBE toxin-antitoxin system